jgi:hypothetical protein
MGKFYTRKESSSKTDKSKKYVFIGYSEKSKAYKFYDLIEKKLVISRDVELNEEARWDRKN